MQGAAHEAVVVHREWVVTSQTSLRGAKKIPSLCSEQAVRSHKKSCAGLIYQTHLVQKIEYYIYWRVLIYL